jgi:hypothetical protein
VQAGESQLDCHIHVDTLVSWASQAEAGGCDAITNEPVCMNESVCMCDQVA